MSLTLSAAQAVRAASAYRALIRAQKFTFKGDSNALAAAHIQTRAIFNRFAPSALASTSAASFSPWNPPPPPPLQTSEEVDEYIDAAFEIATYLRRNVVQGVQTTDGNYALRFTPETERGSNDTIKAPSLSEARPLRPPLEGGNDGVKRRRRTPKPVAASSCCGGGCHPPASTGPESH